MSWPREATMTTAAYTSSLDLAVGVLLLAAVLIVWRHELTAMVRVLAVQGIALAVIPFVGGIYSKDGAEFAAAAGVLALRALLLPWLLTRAVRAEATERRESTPLINTTASLLVAGGLMLAAFAVGRPLVELDPSPSTRAAPAALAAALLGLFVIVSRRRAVSQAVGFLMLDNGITATAFLTTAGVPSIVELGASLDVLFAVLILGVLTGRLHRIFGDTDLDQLRELHD
jgi:hydrogenase-4 component E